MNKVSVIVPVYNTEKYLERCIDSVINQSYKNWELILVDDGSFDSSGKVCDSFASNFESIICFHQKNGGVTSARRFGVSKASGEWIFFLDSDDTLPSDAIQKLVNESSENYDIIIGSLSNHRNINVDVMSSDEYRHSTIAGWHFHTGPVAKLYRKVLFDDFTLDIPREVIFGEDMIMNIRLAFKNHKEVKIIPDIVYTYSLNESCVTKKFKTSDSYESLFRKYWELSIPISERAKYARSMFRKSYDGFVSRLLDDFTRRQYCIFSDEEFKYAKMIAVKYSVRLTKGESFVLFCPMLFFVRYYFSMKYRRDISNHSCI